MTHNQLPQMRALSTNVCPNAQPRSIADLSMCDEWALTAWGYCLECYRQDRVPAQWLRGVDAEIVRLVNR